MSTLDTGWTPMSGDFESPGPMTIETATAIVKQIGAWTSDLTPGDIMKIARGALSNVNGREPLAEGNGQDQPNPGQGE